MTDLPEDSDESDDASDSLADLADTVANRQEPDDEATASETSSYTDVVEELAATGEDDSSVGDLADSASPPTESGTIEPGTNALVFGALRGDAADGACIDLLSEPGADGPPENVLLVTVTRDADDRLDVLRSHAPTSPKRVTVVQSGRDNRKRTHTRAAGPDGPRAVSVLGVDHPSDLTRLGVTVTRVLKEWTNTPGRTAVCLHSLTGLLQYVSQERLFRFVHILQAKLDGENVTAHFHMDPDAHAPDTLSVFRSLFDTVVTVDDDGMVEVTAGEW